MDLNEARKKLEGALGENLRVQYFAHLRQWLLFNTTETRDGFDEKVRSLFQNNEQVDCHKHFILALFNVASSSSVKQVNNNKGVFEAADFADYILPKHLNRSLPANYTYPRAAAELFAPYSGFLTCRINIVAWECGMDGADTDVTPLVAHACQTFLKNIITAMVTKTKGYKVRDGMFQYGFNRPIPDPYLKNADKLEDDTAELYVGPSEDMLLPTAKKSLERVQIERARTYAASKGIKTGTVLSIRLLYDTIRDNPDLFGQHSIHSVQTLKLSLHESNYLSSTEDEDSDGSF